MTTLAVAVFGFGYWGPNHVRVLQREIGARTIVVDPDPERRAAARSLFPDIETAPSLAESPVAPDAAIICSPPVTHEEVAGAALRAGCHVLVEKPLAVSSVAGARLVALADQHDRILMTGHTYDFHPAVARLESLAASGEFGTIRYLDSARLSVGGYRTDVNVMWDMAPHDIVIMSRVMGAWPNRVTAWSSDHIGFGMNDVATMRLEFPGSGTLGYVRVSWLDPVKVRRLSVIGSERMAVFNDAADPRTPLRLIETGAEDRLGEGARHPLPGAYPEELITTPDIEPVEPLTAELRYFAECIRTGQRPTRSSGQDGVAVLEVLEAADRSAETGLPQPVGDGATASGVAR